jgi:hypothetical protein
VGDDEPPFPTDRSNEGDPPVVDSSNLFAADRVELQATVSSAAVGMRWRAEGVDDLSVDRGLPAAGFVHGCCDGAGDGGSGRSAGQRGAEPNGQCPDDREQGEY